MGQTTVLHELLADAWKSNISPAVNSVLSDRFIGRTDPATGDLDVINDASKEMAGGLVSDKIIPLPASKFFGLDIIVQLDPAQFPHVARLETDFKIILIDSTGKKTSANNSLQYNSDKGIWQIGANDGAGWVDTQYTKPITPGFNRIQIRSFFDGKLWGITGVKVNDDGVPYAPTTPLQTAPTSTWDAPLLLVQLQTEVRKTPFILQEVFHRVRVLESDAPIPYTFD